MRIAFGSDHRGLELKNTLMRQLKTAGYECRDFGAYSNDSADYPDYAKAVGEAIMKGECERGILVCGTGIGMCIAANKMAGIRAAACYSVFLAERARKHNDANVLCLGAEIEAPISDIVSTFISTAFEGGRHQRRVDKVSAIEQERR